MNAGTVALASGQSSHTLAAGVYKIVSSNDVTITGDDAAYETVVTTQNKDNDPKLPPRQAATILGPLDQTALTAFMAEPEAKGGMSF